MKFEASSFVGYAGRELPAYFWLPEGEVKAVLQVTHGMTEHMGRYETFGRFLTERGIALAGFDLRGHGKNSGDAAVASFGEGGWEASIQDMRLFFWLVEERFPQVPHFMLGFSLGSFLLREYLAKYSKGISGAIIMGTGHQPGWVLSIMMTIVQGQIRKAGFDNTTELVRNLSFGTYNQKFKPNRTEADWLCADEAELDKYLADPLVRKDISGGLFRELLGSMKRTGSADVYQSWDKALPVLLLCGAEDPVGDASKGVQRVCSQMQKAGMDRVAFQSFAGARHDLLHEEAGCADQVRQCIAQWMEGIQ